VFYPQRGEGLVVPSGDLRRKYVAKVKSLGFEGIELGLDALGTAADSDEATADLLRDLEEEGLPCVALRGGGNLVDPRFGPENEAQLPAALDMATKLKVGIVNLALAGPPTDPAAPGATYGETVSQGSSRQAKLEDYDRTARIIASLADRAAAVGVQISIELHQRSIVDNSWTLLRLIDMIDRPNVGVNADAANTYWAYEDAEESFEDAITALAPRSNYWHCKNLTRLHIPELHRAIYTRVPIPYGDLDYRFAVSAMIDAGYDGMVGIEGLRVGDQLSGDAESLNRLKSLFQELS
jgi:sugar phosphate isomerase/epimerase